METDLILGVNSQSFCRCCLLVDTQENMKFLNMRSDTVLQITIIESFHKYCISPEETIASVDDNPKICQHCAVQLENIVLFKTMCSKANALLHQKIQQDQEQEKMSELLGFSNHEMQLATQQLDGTQTCNLPTTSIKSTAAATRTHHCSICQTSHMNRSSLLQHIKSHEQPHKAPTPKRHPCKKCDKIYDTESRLKTHVKSQHTIICKICGKTFKHHRHLWQHSLRHTEDVGGLFKRFNCPSCNFKAMTRRALKKHFKRNHEMKEEALKLFVPIQEIKVEVQNDSQ